jgi:hypothetical protein
MFSLTTHKMIKDELKFSYNDSSKINWRLRDESLVPTAHSIADIVNNISNNTIPPCIKLFKLNDRKATLLLDNQDSNGRLYVIKIFFLKRLENKLKYHKYALDESANLLIAQKRKINVPEVYGYGAFKNSFLGLVKTGVIILEYLPNVYTIGELIDRKNEVERQSIFLATIPLFVSLYNAGCNHIDINNHAVMMTDDTENKTYLLDFQHAKFYDNPSIEILIFEMGYFAKSCRDYVSEKTINEWVTQILTCVNIIESSEQQSVKSRFRYYYNKKLSRKHRRNLI